MFLASLSLRLGAYVVQSALTLTPCMLCHLQQWLLAGIATLSALGYIWHAHRKWVLFLTGCLGILILLGVGLAGYQVWRQQHPALSALPCAPGLEYLWENFPIMDAIHMVLESGECGKVDWEFFNISLAGWSLLGFSVLLFLWMQFAWYAQKNRG